MGRITGSVGSLEKQARWPRGQGQCVVTMLWTQVRRALGARLGDELSRPPPGPSMDALFMKSILKSHRCIR